MNTNGRRSSQSRILLDLNTQCDFLLPGGAMPVANRAEALPKIRQLMNWARLHQVPVISSLEAHRASESFKGFPPHCLDHTLGQKKLPFTLLPNRMLLMGDNTADVPVEPFRRIQQLIFTKRNADFLSNPKADRLINTLSPDYWIIFGVTATHCIKSVTLGLLARHHRVAVVRDACGYWSQVDAEHAFRQMEAKGAMMVTSDELTAGAVADRIKSQPVPLDVTQDEDPLDRYRIDPDAEETAADDKKTEFAPAGDRCDGVDKSDDIPRSSIESPPAGRNGRGKRSELHPNNLADFVPAHLVRRKNRSNGARPRRGLA